MENITELLHAKVSKERATALLNELEHAQDKKDIIVRLMHELTGKTEVTLSDYDVSVAVITLREIAGVLSSTTHVQVEMPTWLRSIFGIAGAVILNMLSRRLLTRANVNFMLILASSIAVHVGLSHFYPSMSGIVRFVLTALITFVLTRIITRIVLTFKMK